MYLCIVYGVGEPQEGEPDFVSEVRNFTTLEEAMSFAEENSDYCCYTTVYKAERV